MSWWDSNVAPLLGRPDTAGMLGSLVGSFVGTVPGNTRLQRAINVGGGMVIAYYMGPIVADTLGVQNPRAQTGIGFLAGMLGLMLLQQIGASIKTIDWKARIDAVLDRIFGVKKP